MSTTEIAEATKELFESAEFLQSQAGPQREVFQRLASDFTGGEHHGLTDAEQHVLLHALTFAHNASSYLLAKWSKLEDAKCPLKP